MTSCVELSWSGREFWAVSSLLSFGEKSLVNSPITRKKNKRGDCSSTEEVTNVAKRPNNKPNAHEEDNENMADRKESDHAASEEEPTL